MKKTKILGVIAIVAILMLIGFWVVWYMLSANYTGLVVSYGGNPTMFELQGDSGKNYGFVVTDKTELVWEDTSALDDWKGSQIDYDDWSVFGCSMRVEVVAGEETESADEYIDECVEAWYIAEKVTVTKVEEDYFAVCYKPVIYLYPEEEINVDVSLNLEGKLTCTYPEYEEGWQVTAMPNGTLYDEEGQSYNYLYWEGIADIEYDFSKGFCVAGEDTAKFLEDVLAKLGLNRKEANEFIVYWLPLMQENAYNLISFQTDTYTEAARLNIEPNPDTVIRVFMAWKPITEVVEIEPQNLTSPVRKGFTVVEWGGTEVD